MTQFAYTARDSQGRLLHGVVEAPSALIAAEQLATAGAVPVNIIEKKTEVSTQQFVDRLLRRDKPTRVDLILFTRQMYALSKAGVPITMALRKLAQTSRSQGLIAAMESIIVELESGRDLAGAMARHPKIFSPLMVSMVRVGEQSGQLDQAFLRLNQHLEREQRTIEQIKTAVRYPIIVIVAVAIAIIILMVVVIPPFARMYASFNLTLPLPTRIIIDISGFMSAYWWLVIGAIIAAVFFFRNYVATDAGRAKLDEFMLKIPVIGSIILRATLARFARSFAMASRAGVPVLQALTVVSLAVDNEAISRRLTGMRSLIERGDSISRAATAQNIFTPLVLQMLSVGEETGQIDDMLEEVAEFYEREVDYDVKNLNDLLQPVLTVFVAGIVFILALGVFLPMWDLVQLARQGP